MTDATIALKVDTSGLKQGQAEISKLQKSGTDAERSLNQSTDKVSKGWTGAKTAVVGLTAAVSALGAAAAVRQIVNYADAWQNATNQLKTVQKETESLTATQEKLLAVSNDSRQGFESTAGLYTRLSRATESLNLNQDELIGLTNTINKSFAVSGASATEANAAIVQLSQGLAAGALRGDEFNSVSEQSPILMQAIADSLNMTRGELRAFAAEGGITAEIVVNALQQASGEIDETFGKMSATFEQNMTVAGNNLLEFVGNANIVKSTSSVVGSSIVLLSENIELVGSAAKIVATVLTVRMVPALAKSAAGMAAAATSGASLGSALTLLGGPVGIAAIAAGSIVALALAFKNLKEEQDNARQGAASYISGNGGLKSVDLAIIGTQKEIERLREVIKEDNGIFSHFVGSQSSKAQDEIKKLEDFLEDLKREHEALSSQQVETTQTTNTLTTAQIEALGAADRLLLSTNSLSAGITEENRVIDEINRAQEESNRLKKEAAEQAKKVEDAIAKQVMEMNIEYVSLQLTSRQQAIFNAELKAFNEGAAPEAIKKIGELAGRNFDLEQAQKDATSASRELAKETTTSTESMETDLGRLGNTAVDTFAQMLVSGGDAMDGLKRVFENAIADMISTFIKSGLSNIFSGGGFGSAVGAAASSIFGGGAAAAGTAGAGGIAAGIGSTITGAASSIAGGVASAGSAAMGALSAIPGWGWALGGAAVLAKVLDSGGTMSSNAGMLTQDLGHAGSFDIDTFPSGAEFTGFARRSDQQGATANIDAFREVDGYLTNVYKEIFGSAPSLKASDFIGYDENGQGRGAFFGAASEDGGGSGVPMDQQLTKYASRWIELAAAQSGTSQDAVNEIIGGASSVTDILSKVGGLVEVDGSHRSGLNRVPFDGYVAQLHKGERVKTASEARQEDSMASMMGDLKVQIVRNTQLMLSIVQRWDFDGLPATRA